MIVEGGGCGEGARVDGLVVSFEVAVVVGRVGEEELYADCSEDGLQRLENCFRVGVEDFDYVAESVVAGGDDGKDCKEDVAECFGACTDGVEARGEPVAAAD